MTAKPPASGLPRPPEAADAAVTLAALEAACEATDLPDAARVLLKQACDALRASAQDAQTARLRYHALFDAVPDPVSILDETGTVLDLNKAGLAAYRRPREEIVGQPIHVLNPELPHDHLNPVWERINRGQTYVIEVTNMRGDGSRFPVEVHSAGFVHDGRNCIVAVARDLSGRRDAEWRYRELMETIDRAILVQDTSGRVMHANIAAMRLFGIGEGQRINDELRSGRWRTSAAGSGKPRVTTSTSPMKRSASSAATPRPIPSKACWAASVPATARRCAMRSTAPWPPAARSTSTSRACAAAASRSGCG